MTFLCTLQIAALKLTMTLIAPPQVDSSRGSKCPFAISDPVVGITVGILSILRKHIARLSLANILWSPVELHPLDISSSTPMKTKATRPLRSGHSLSTSYFVFRTNQDL